MVDNARWYLQDFLPRIPRFNFGEEYANRFVDDIEPRVAILRQRLLDIGYPKNPPHHPAFVVPVLASLNGRLNSSSS
jgi:hypothetical protein